MKHNVVEEDDGCSNADRLGPFSSPDEAARALEIVRERNEKWDAEDEAWNSGG
ncbi:MAG TPA: hypothetical protein VGH85_03375 [Mycobacteriales bacterium]